MAARLAVGPDQGRRLRGSCLREEPRGGYQGGPDGCAVGYCRGEWCGYALWAATTPENGCDVCLVGGCPVWCSGEFPMRLATRGCGGRWSERHRASQLTEWGAVHHR
eukprot:1146161-Pelagomonas_calceolata.AAC.2